MIFRKRTFAAAALLLSLLSVPAAAEPMRCSTQQQACTAACAKLHDASQVRACLTGCTQRMAHCQRTGCWDNGSGGSGGSYCNLLRR